ncbi:MAG: hypothetical protein HQL52_06745 [Magnetococcales bacterium]|nr:hypothetical protein [Magnetococcales bacterium]
MENYPADITIHIDETLDDDQRVRLTHTLILREGVHSVQFQTHNPHLMNVRYDPKRVSATDINRLVQHYDFTLFRPLGLPHGGLHTQMIGL